jgi:transposase
MRIIIKEIRQRAIAAYKTGRFTQAHLAEVYGVTRKTVSNWLRIERTEHRVEPLPRGHKRESFSAEEKERLILLIKQRPDITLYQIREAMGNKCTIPTVHNTLRRLGLFLKKNSSGQRTRS